jgi:AraC-like DNA-binding protein
MFTFLGEILTTPGGTYFIAGLLLLCCFALYYLIKRIVRSIRKKKRGRFLPYDSLRSSSLYWGNNSSYLHSRYDDLRTKSDKQLLVNRVIELYTRNGSLAKTARATGLTERKVNRILIRARFLPYDSPRSSTQYWSNDDKPRTKSNKLIKVEHVIQTYSRNGSLSKTAKATGYSERKVKRILIDAGKYTTKKEAERIFAKHK